MRGRKLLKTAVALATFDFKVGQILFQNGAKEVILKKGKTYFKVEQLIQSETVISKRYITYVHSLTRHFTSNFQQPFLSQPLFKNVVLQ